MAKKLGLSVIIRGGGEAASAVAHRLARAHLNVLLTEIAQPLAVSRGAAFCEAVYEGQKEVEGMVARLVRSPEEAPRVWQSGEIPIIVDPALAARDIIRPDVLVDAVMAKANLGTKLSDAPLVIGLGPGFEAGRDAHLVVETNNSEGLGMVLSHGQPEANTGMPIAIGGLTSERVQHAPVDGVFSTDREMGDVVVAGDLVGRVAGQAVTTEIDGIIRALLRPGVEVSAGTKLGEVDPSTDRQAPFRIRARMRAIAGGVLEAIMMRYNV